MARIFPFTPYRYTDAAGSLDTLATQPYDKITPSMKERYLQANPYNLVRIILGEPSDSDTESNNVYTRAASYLTDWIAEGILAKDPEPALFAYFQTFEMPDTGERTVRKGFIGLGAVEDYSRGVVFRHEQTLTGPKKGRLELLKQTHAHFGQLFMLYPDPEGAIDLLLDEAAADLPTATMTDEYGVEHTLWRIADPVWIEQIQELMESKKLLIADGHHRYETAVAFRDANPDLAGADRVMMTFVNMHSSGLTILAAHRVVAGIGKLDVKQFLDAAAIEFDVAKLASVETLQGKWATLPPEEIYIGAMIGDELYGLRAKNAAGRLNITVLHEDLIGRALGISEEAVRNEEHLRYVRGLDNAVAEARAGSAQIAFLVQPMDVQQVASISFGGGVMPQKSTDFYPKLVSGLTIYKLEG